MRLNLAVTLSFFCFIAACSNEPAELVDPVDTLYRGGPVLTMNDDIPVAAALAVKSGRIHAVVEEGDGIRYIGPDTEIIDLNGHVLLPGFIQAHAHFSFMTVKDSASSLDPPPIGSVGDMATLIDELTKGIAALPPEGPVFALGYDDTMLAEQRHPTRDDLDAVTTTRPIALLHISGHLATMNSKALELAGLTAETPDPVGGIIRRRPGTNEPTGVLEETALQYAAQFYPRPSAAEAFANFSSGLEKLAGLGITTAVDHASDVQMEQAYEAFYDNAAQPVDLVAYRRITPGNVNFEKITQDYKNGYRVGGFKITIDGSIQGYTGYLGEPYYQIPEGYAEDYRGYPLMPADEFEFLVLTAFENQIPLLVHTNGDAAIDMYTEAVRKAQAAYPDANVRPVFIHAQMMRSDQIQRAKELGMIPSFFVDHVYYWGDRHRDIFMGAERAARISPAGEAVREGLIFTLHDDAPVVPPHPLRTVWAAVNRQTADGAVLGEDQKLSVEQALKAVTINAAFQHFEENEKGSLEAGKQADMIILDQNPLDVDPLQIRNIEVLTTINDGEVIYSRAQ